MADISDVAKSIQRAVQQIRATAFPTGVVLYGWPVAAEFAVAQRVPLVTVAQRTNYWRNTTRHPGLEWAMGRPAPTLTVSIAGTTATFAGSCSTDQIAGVQVGTTAWAVRCSANDTPTTVAAALATLSGGTASGPALTLSGLVAARTGQDAVSYRITRQQEVQFGVTVWTSDPDQRDTVSAAIDSVLADMQYLALPDGSQGRLTWIGSNPTDEASDADIYRRDIFYAVDFPTTRRFVRTPTLFYGVNYAAGSAGFYGPALDESGQQILDEFGQQIPVDVVQPVTQHGALHP